MKRKPEDPQERLLLSIQATHAALEWDEGQNVSLIVRTVLPDSYVLSVVEELQAQAEKGLALPEVFIRIEVPGLTEAEVGKDSDGSTRSERAG